MGRHRLYAGLFLLAAGLLGWIGWAAGQRPEGHPPIIASSDPPPAPIRTSAYSSPVTGTTLPPSPALPGPAWSLAVEKTGPPALTAGVTTQYDIVLRNNGMVPLQRVRIEEELPADAQLVATEPRADTQPSPLVWKLARLDVGAQQRLRVTLRPARDGVLPSFPRVSFAPPETVAAPLEPDPGTAKANRPLLVARVSGPDRARIGESVVFLVEVANAGPVPATHVVLHDLLPDGLRHPQGPRIEADLGTIAPGDTRSIHLTTIAIRAGRLVNEVSATGDGNLHASDLTTVVIEEK